MPGHGKGAFFSQKLLTTPEDPAVAFRQILREALAARGGSGREVTEVLHATTIATNAILEGKTARLEKVEIAAHQSYPFQYLE